MAKSSTGMDAASNGWIDRADGGALAPYMHIELAADEELGLTLGWDAALGQPAVLTE